MDYWTNDLQKRNQFIELFEAGGIKQTLAEISDNLLKSAFGEMAVRG